MKYFLRTKLRKPRLYIFSILLYGITLLGVQYLVSYIYAETAYDKDIPDYKNIYRIISKDTTNFYTYGGCNFYIDEILNKLPDIELITQIFTHREDIEQSYKQENQWRKCPKIIYVDSAFFKIFPIDVVEGQLQSFNQFEDHILISKDFKNKIYPNKSPIGESMEFRFGKATRYIKIIGIFENNTNSHLNMDIIAPIAGAYWLNNFDNSSRDAFSLPYFEYVNNVNSSVYFKLINTNDLFSLTNKINKLAQKSFDKTFKHKINLQELSKIRLYSYHFESDVQTPGNIFMVIIATALLIILISVLILNYIYFGITIFIDRLKEYSLKKIAGIKNLEFFFSNLVENTAILLISYIIFYGVYRLFVNYNIIEPILINTPIEVYVFLIGGVIVLASVSALVSTFALSGLSPLNTLRNRFTYGTGKRAYNNSLIAIQLAVFILVFTFSGLLNKQVQHSISNNTLGFNTENLLSIYVKDIDFNKVFDRFCSELLLLEDVIHVAGSMCEPPANNYDILGYGVPGEGRKKVHFNWVTPQYLNTLGIKVIKGNDFINSSQGRDDAVMVNEAFEKESRKEVIGEKIYIGGEKQIIGVFADFHSDDINTSIKPMVLSSYDMGIQQIIVRLAQNYEPKVIAQIRNVFAKYSDEPFQYQFNDDLGESVLAFETELGHKASLIAMLLSVVLILSLYTTTHYVFAKRKKEFGIRKIVGANKWQIYRELTKSFLFIFGVVNGIVIPLTYILFIRFQENFVHRVEIEIADFCIPICISAVLIFPITIINIHLNSKINPILIIQDE